MRISDWSSDVCSSDLAARSPPVGAARRVRGWTETKSCCGNLLRLRSVGQGNIEARARECTLTRPTGRRAALPFRSEEHTSELQSLMRISYAVFRLKTQRSHET